MKQFAIYLRLTIDQLLNVSNFSNRRDDLRHIRNRELFEILRVRHRHIHAGNALYGSIKIIERPLLNLRDDLGANAAERMRLFGNDDAIRFLARK